MKCVRCGEPVQPPFKKFCSDACRDTYQRAQIQAKIPKGIPRRTYRVYDYRRPEVPP